MKQSRRSRFLPYLVAACIAVLLATAISIHAQYTDKDKSPSTPAKQQSTPSDEGPDSGPNSGVGETVIVPKRQPAKPARRLRLPPSRKKSTPRTSPCSIPTSSW